MRSTVYNICITIEPVEHCNLGEKDVYLFHKIVKYLFLIIFVYYLII